MVDELIAGRYELEELVGTGGMSSVYRAHDRLLERDVALKVLHEQYTVDGDYVERFRREARSVAQLSHPNIVTVIDRGEQDGRQFIVFEYVDGENLKLLVERRGPLPEREAVDLTLQIARALGFAHEHGLVHRDVKPQNVLLNGDGRAKVTDFGIARSLDVQGGLTQTGTVLGTSDYIAPEQARGAKATVQSDVYSLGAMLYELLTGEVPFPGDNFVAVAMRHINEPVPSVRERRPDVSPRLDAVIRRAMAKDPRDRYGSMDELCTELSGCLEPESSASGAQTMVVAPPRKPTRRERRAARPPAGRPSIWPLILLLAGLALLAGILAAVFAFTGAKDTITGGSTKPKTTAATTVRLTGVSSYDPEGDNKVEHPEAVGLAADGDPSTFWTTEHYDSGQLNKSGVGVVLDAGSTKRLTEMTVTTDTVGFTAQIQAGSSQSGPFRPVSSPRTVGSRTMFTLNGANARYYLVWITDLGGLQAAHVN
ncbi:MAG TPA: protein kinase, partial [Gaiellaceae bacterium]|nr:protein kinase [Gaiellaceae bacterium]